MCRCHTTLWYIQSSLQGEAAVESVAMKSRHDPRIVGANMKTLGYREGGGVGGGGGTVRASKKELSTNWNVNCTGLHNLRLMREQQQIRSPSFLFPLARLWQGAFH